MIDFRYHLISIVAVLLALAIGVVLGSGLLGDVALRDIEARADAIRRQNDEVRALAEERGRLLDEQERFAQEVRSYLIPGTLSAVDIVMLQLPGVDDDISDEFSSLLTEAGATIPATIELTDRFELDDEIVRDQLSVAVGSFVTDEDELRRAAFELLGRRLQNAATGRTGATARLEDLLGSLREAGFVQVRGPEGQTVPAGSSFVILGGDEEVPYPLPEHAGELVGALTRRNTAVVVGETSEIPLSVVDVLRDTVDPAASLSTVEGVDSIYGRIAGVLALSRTRSGDVVHVGIGADTVLPPPPSPTPSPSP